MTQQELEEQIAAINWDEIADEGLCEREVHNCFISVKIGGELYEVSEDEESPAMAKKYAIKAIKTLIRSSNGIRTLSDKDRRESNKAVVGKFFKWGDSPLVVYAWIKEYEEESGCVLVLNVSPSDGTIMKFPHRAFANEFYGAEEIPQEEFERAWGDTLMRSATELEALEGEIETDSCSSKEQK